MFTLQTSFKPRLLEGGRGGGEENPLGINLKIDFEKKVVK
jgi:hypothetical protein